VFLKCLLASHFTLFRLCTLLWFGACNHIILACFHWSEEHKHSLSNHRLWCCNLYRPRVSLAEVLIFSGVFSQALFMSSLSLKFSKTANLFVISIWNCFLMSSSFSFLKLNLSLSYFCAAWLLTANLSLNFATGRWWSVSQSTSLKDRTWIILEYHLLTINV